MASLTKTTTGSGQTRWRARYRDPDGRQREKWFPRKVDGEKFLTQIEGAKLAGTYLDPAAGKVTFAEFSQAWFAAQTFDESTREAMEVRIRRHMLPTFGAMQMRAVQPLTVQAWTRGRLEDLSPRYVRVMLTNLSSIFGSAVDNGVIARNPCRSIDVAVPKRKVVPWTVERVAAVTAALPERYRPLVASGAGCGLRQGEAFGLRAMDVGSDVLRIEQQVKIVKGRVVIAPPKRGKTREVPLPKSVAAVLAELEPDPSGLLVVSRERKPINRGHFNRYVWKPALIAAGVEPTRANGFHALRHHYASVLLDAGVSIRALADYLGHDDPGFTLRTYTHLMPATEDRARLAIDAVWGSRGAGGLR